MNSVMSKANKLLKHISYPISEDKFFQALNTYLSGIPIDQLSITVNHVKNKYQNEKIIYVNSKYDHLGDIIVTDNAVLVITDSGNQKNFYINEDEDYFDLVVAIFDFLRY